MSHTRSITVPGATVSFIHNGGFDGDVEIRKTLDGEITPTETVTLPFEALKGFVAEYVRYKRECALGDAAADEVFGIPGPRSFGAMPPPGIRLGMTAAELVAARDRDTP